MDLGLRGRVAVVGGASQGIGFAAAMALAREGAAVAICGRNAKALDAAARELGQGGATIVPVVADLATEAGILALTRAVTDRLPPVDILVTNTGGPPTGATLSHDWAAWTRASELLLRSVVELCRAFVPGMRERRWGRVIGVTSLAVKNPVPSLALTNALRAGVTGYYRTLAEEIAADGVTVNTVLPGYVRTRRLLDLAKATSERTGEAEEAVLDGWRRLTPMGRLGEPEELGAAIAFLASERAAFITGQAIAVDGGVVRGLL